MERGREDAGGVRRQVQRRAARGEWWRLVTAGFLHGGLLHILMNSWVLFDLGAQVEEIYGASRMWVIYFVSSVCGFYASAVWMPRFPWARRPG